jgi:hypothetical protein
MSGRLDPTQVGPFGDPASVHVRINNLLATAVSGANNHTAGFLAGPNPLDGRTGVGVFGTSDNLGVFGFANTGTGVGVAGNSVNGAGTGVQGHTSTGIGVLGTSNGSGKAGEFRGDVEITGDLKMTASTVHCFDVAVGGGDCAEHFHISDAELIDPGMVMVIMDDGGFEGMP